MTECTDPEKQKISAANPGNQTQQANGIQINTVQNNIFNPNNLLSAVQTYMSFNNVANKMLGIEAKWFRAVPQQRSKDVIFQEYTLSCVEEKPICINVMVKDGNLPDDNYQYDLMGLEYQLPTTIEIDKKYWEELSGFGTAPQKKDIVYLSMPNKIYQVESTFLKRGFMQQETTWVINLIKYQPEASRKESVALKETLDQYTVSEEELFGKRIEEDVEKLTDKKQMSPMSSTSRDKYKQIEPNLNILNVSLNIDGIIVSDSAYDLNTSELFNAIIYSDSNDNIRKIDDRSLTTWVKPKPDNTKEYSVGWIMPDTTLTPPANFKIKINGGNRFVIGDTFTIWRSEKLVFYATVVDDSYSNSGIYWCQIDDTVINYLNTIQTNWYTKPNWKMIVTLPINLIDGVNETLTGFTVNMYSNQYIKIKYGIQEHISILNNKLKPDNWYGIVVNIGNTWGLYNVYVWEVSNDINKLKTYYYETVKFVPEETTINQYTLNKSNSLMTNIRLFNSTIEEEKQINELLSYFTQNAHAALILDNADLKFIAPYISQQR